MLNEEYILKHFDDFELLTTSSNQVYRFTYEDENYIMKKNYLSDDHLSPFWYMMNRIYGNSFTAQRKNIQSILDLLMNNPSVGVAKLVGTSDKYQYQLYKEVDGIKYEPDDFPDSDVIEYQLGRYIGYFHSIKFHKYGTYPEPDREGDCFNQAITDCMQYLIDTYWKDDKNVRDYFEDIRGIRLVPSSYSLIMPDISANQFVYSQDMNSIHAVVDFDAYVVGPREWELSILELCLKNGDAFRNGYETFTTMPDLSEARRYYRFLSYLCDPWEKKDLQCFLEKNSFL